MNIIEWIIWVIGVLVLLFFVPFYFHPRAYFVHLFKIFAFLIVMGLVLTASTQLSKLHLLWWIPLSFILTIGIFHAELQWSFNRVLKKWREMDEQDEVAIEHRELVPEYSEKQITDAEQVNSSGSAYYEEIPCDTVTDRQTR